MKRITLLLGVFAFGLTMIHGQSWVGSNRVTFSGSWKELNSRISQKGGILAYGYFEGTLTSADGKSIDSNGDRDYFLIHFHEDGAVDWMRNFGSSLSDYITGGMSTDTSANIYISGGFRGLLKASDTDSIVSNGSHDMFLIKLDNSGKTLWSRNAGEGAKLQSSTALEIDPFGDLILAGIFNDSIQIYNQQTLYSENEAPDYFYGKFNASDGDLQWIKHGKSLNTLGGRIDNIYADASSYLFTGSYNDSISFGIDTILSVNKNTDVHLISTDLLGEITWIRKLRGVGNEFCYSQTKDDEGSTYLSGYYESDTLIVDSTENVSIKIGGRRGNTDLFLVKYSADGDLKWIRTNGSTGTDKTYYVEFFNEQVIVSGSFTDTLIWGGDTLTSEGLSDIDMFLGAIDKEGIFKGARQYKGSDNSEETGKEFIKTDEEIFTLISTNSKQIVIADSVYTSDGTSFYMVLGVKGCLPISIDNVKTQDVVTCYGDSTGSLQIFSSGGFGGPFEYSIDNGTTFFEQSNMDKLPAGNYEVAVRDKENCKKYGEVQTIKQPDSLAIEVVSTSKITESEQGEIVVAAMGGTPPYIFTLQPNGNSQGSGTFTFGVDESGIYVVEVSDTQNCGPVSTDTLGIFVTNLELQDYQEFTIYPNPSSGVITLEMPFDGSEASLEVLSLTGQVMYSRQVYSSGGMINETINLSDLSKKMYMIRVDGQTLKSGVVLN